jgi:hypothetical protein
MIADGGDPDGATQACPPTKPAIGAPCNIFINNTSCVYGGSNCFCMIATWSCVP